MGTLREWRRLIAAAACALGAGCGAGYAHQLVARDQLARLAEAPGAEEVVLRAADGKAVRVDARSRLRFHINDGRVTEWVAAKDLIVSPDGVALSVRVRPPDPSLAEAVVVRITALDAATRALLADGMPPDSVAVLPDGTLEIHGTGPLGTDWIRGFLLAAARVRSPQLADRDALEALRDRLAKALRLDPPELGRWHFLTPPAPELGAELDGAALFDALDGATYTSGGARWPELAGAEVENLSGARTFGITVAGVALCIALLPVLLLARSAPIGSLGESPAADAPDAQAERRTPGASATAPGARLFSPAARRRAIVRFVPALEIGGDPIAGANLMDSASFSLRFADVIELGGGARHLLVSSANHGLRSRAMGFFRVQGHFELDARRRFALAFGLDIGGGGDVNVQARLNLSFRVRCARRLFAGVFLFNPMYSNYAAPSTNPSSGFTFPSGVELGAAF